MMGITARAFGALPPVSLEALIPPNHCDRHPEQSLDPAFVRDRVRRAYADGGRPSIDPVVFFKLQPILCFEGLRSERRLLRVVADRLSLRWHLGDDPTQALPDHSRRTRLRERYGLDVFRRFVETVVARCIAAGLVRGEEFSIDAAKAAANCPMFTGVLASPHVCYGQEEGTMATTMQTTTDQKPSVLPPAEARALFDRQARRLLNLSGDEFLARWDAGAYRDLPDTPEGRRVGYVALLIPFGRKTS